MPRKRVVKEPDQAVLPEMPETEEPSEATGTMREYAKRLTLPLNEDGTAVAWDTMRPATVEKYRALLGVGFATAPKAVEITANEVEFLYQAIGTIESWIAQRFFGVDGRLANLAFRYTPDEMAMLTDPTIAVLQKYGAGMGKYKDEVSLALALYAVHARKIQWIQEEAARVVKQRMDQEDLQRRGGPRASTEFQA